LTFREQITIIKKKKFPKEVDIMNNLPEIQELLQQRADLLARLHLLPYDGTPEIKENKSGKYLYVRKRVGSRVTSTYVDVYSEELYQLLLRNNRESRELKKQIRKVEKQLAEAGFIENELASDVILNLEFARTNMKLSIYEQAVLEGVATSFPQTEDIIENGTVNGVTASDVQKILNLKHAWEFILDKDVIQVKSDYSVLCHIAKLVNEGFFSYGGRIRGVPVTIGGTTYKPPMPIETVVMENIQSIIETQGDAIDVAIELCLYCMKTQIFNDGNKRASVIFANHYLIANAGGLLVIPEANVPEFKKLLVRYYEDKDTGEIKEFLKLNCHKYFK
jgi:prophage maintenance system killer protein